MLQALDKAGRFDVALRIMEDRWIKRMVNRGATSTYEEWGYNGTWRNGRNFAGILRSQSHAWSAFPAEFLQKHLAGLEILEAGCGKVKIEPKEVSFDYDIVFPLPQGNVNVKKKGAKITIEAPERVAVIK